MPLPWVWSYGLPLFYNFIWLCIIGSFIDLAHVLTSFEISEFVLLFYVCYLLS